MESHPEVRRRQRGRGVGVRARAALVAFTAGFTTAFTSASPASVGASCQDDEASFSVEAEALLERAAEEDFAGAVGQAWSFSGRHGREGRSEEVLEVLADLSALFPEGEPMRGYLFELQALAALGLDDPDRALSILDRYREFLDGNDITGPYTFEERRLRGEAESYLGLLGTAAPRFSEAVAGYEELHHAGERVLGPLVNAYCSYLENLASNGRHEQALEEAERIREEAEEVFRAKRPGAARFDLIVAKVLAFLAFDDPARFRQAEESLVAVLEGEASPPETRFDAALFLARLKIRNGALDAAEDFLRRAREAVPEEALGSGSFALLHAVAAKLALESGAEPAVLEEHRITMERAFRRILERIDRTESRAAGTSFLRYDSTRLALGRLMELHVALDPAQGPRRAFDALLELQQRAVLARELGRESSVEDVQRLLRAGQGMLVYAPLDHESSFLFVVEASDLSVLRTPASHTRIEAAVRAFNREVRTSPTRLRASEREARLRSLDQGARAVVAALLPDELRTRIASWSTLMVAGRDSLNNLPFEALPIGADGRLGQTKSVVVLPPLPAAIAMSARGDFMDETTYDLRLVAEATPSGDYAHMTPLTLTSEQREALRGGLARSHVDLLLGDDATATELFARSAEPARVLHILTHGTRDRSRALSQGLVLSPDGSGESALFGDAVERAGLRAQLVVLAACSSGLGPEREGDAEAATLTGTFLKTGSQAAVVASADLEFAPTVELLSEFTRELRRGSAPSEALRLARVALADAGWDDPYYTSLIHYVGVPQPPLFAPGEPRSRSLWVPALAGLALLAVAAGLVLRRSA